MVRRYDANIHRQFAGQVRNFANAKQTRLAFAGAVTAAQQFNSTRASLYPAANPRTTGSQYSAASRPTPARIHSPQPQAHQGNRQANIGLQGAQSGRAQFNNVLQGQKLIKQQAELRSFIHAERNLVNRDPNLTAREKSWVISNLGQLFGANRASNRDDLLTQHKKMMQYYASDGKVSDGLKHRLTKIANKLASQTSGPQSSPQQASRTSAQVDVYQPSHPSRPTLNFSGQTVRPKQSAAQHSTYQPTQAGVYRPAYQPRPSGNLQFSQRTVRRQQQYNINDELNNVAKTPTLNPLAKKALDTFRQKDYGAALAQMNGLISNGQEANAIKEAINTGFDAVSLGDESVGKQGLNNLHKSKLENVMKLAKDRIDVRVSLGEINADVGNNAKARIDTILKEVNPYNSKSNMKAIMNQLQNDIADSKNALDAQNLLSQGTDKAQRSYGKNASLSNVLSEARQKTTDMPNGREVRDILMEFGEQAGLYKDQALGLLAKHAGGFTENGKGIEHLSQEKLSLVVRLAKLDTPHGSHGEKLTAALNHFAQQAGLKQKLD